MPSELQGTHGNKLGARAHARVFVHTCFNQSKQHLTNTAPGQSPGQGWKRRLHSAPNSLAAETQGHTATAGLFGCGTTDVVGRILRAVGLFCAPQLVW